MSRLNTDASTLILIGERLCLDFANTVNWHAGNQPEEKIISYQKLVAWSRHADILNDSQEKLLIEQADKNPEQAVKVLKKAIELREAIYRLFRSVATGDDIDSVDLSILNQYVGCAYQYAEMRFDEGGFDVTFQKGIDQLDGMLWPIVQSAIDLLRQGDLGRIKQCEGGMCGWLFFDSSRNKSRRWCSMADCGNRANAKRFYRRKTSKRNS